MSPLPTPSDLHSLVIRTDFSDDGAWQAVRGELTARSGMFRANLEFVDDRRYENLTVEGLLALTEDRGRVGVWRHPVDGTAPHTIVAGGVLSGFARSADGTALVYARDTAKHPPALFASRGDGSGERSIESLNRVLLARHTMGDVVEMPLFWAVNPVLYLKGVKVHPSVSSTTTWNFVEFDKQ